VTRSALAGDLCLAFTLERRGGWLALQFARLALIVAAPGRCGGLRGGLARRRRRGPEGLSAASGAQARNLPRKARPVTDPGCAAFRVSVILARHLPGATAARTRRAPRALD
jgi:hypothetical protein